MGLKFNNLIKSLIKENNETENNTNDMNDVSDTDVDTNDDIGEEDPVDTINEIDTLLSKIVTDEEEREVIIKDIAEKAGIDFDDLDISNDDDENGEDYDDMNDDDSDDEEVDKNVNEARKVGKKAGKGSGKMFTPKYPRPKISSPKKVK